MRIHILISTASFLFACGGRQPYVSTGLGYSTGQVTTEPTRPRAVCTPYIDAAGAVSIVKTVCEVDDELYRALLRPRQRQPRQRRAGPVFGFPTDHVEPDEVQDQAEIAAENVDELMSRPDPIAGIGDARAARELLERLPTSVLLATLDILHQRGTLALIAPDWQHQKFPYFGSRLGTALYIFGVSRVRGDPSRDAVATAARAIDELPYEGQYDVLTYLMARRSLPRDVEILVEGFLAFEGAAVQWREPVPLAGTTIGSEAPEPVEPGAWDKPAGQPAKLYIGNAAHGAIARYYEQAHRAQGETVLINHTPLSTILTELANMGHDPKPHALTAAERALRPDIFNLTRLYIYEIKPANAAAEASARASMYIGVMGSAGVSVSLGPSGDIGTSGTLPAPGGVFIFSSPSPGIITYQYRRGRLVPVPVTAEQENPNESPAKSKSKKKRWAWELEPAPEAQRRRILVMVVVTMGAIILAILTAPASA